MAAIIVMALQGVIMLILPFVIMYAMWYFREDLINMMMTIAGPMIDSVLENDVVFEVTGVGAWLFQKCNIAECMTILLTAAFTRFCFSFIKIGS